MARRETNMLEPVAAKEQPNLWLARSEAVVVPLTRAADRDEAFEGVRAFLRATGAEDRKVTAEDVYPFRAIAASDGIDSYFTVQSVEKSLKPMAKDFAAGRSILGNHDYGTFSYGSTTSGKVVDAAKDAPEYEAAFYDEAIKGKPQLATSKWLMTDAYIVRGMNDMGGQASSDSVIRGMELGGIRRVSISFTVGGYRCGIDGKDMLAGWLGDPEPMASYVDDPEACSHFPGVDYGEDGYGFALMEGNRALEESMVYMNSSPSAMLMRKAAVLAERGVLTPSQRSQVEQRFGPAGLRLPRHARRLYMVSPMRNAADDPNKEVAMGANTEPEPVLGERVTLVEDDGQAHDGEVVAVDEGRLVVETEEVATEDVEAEAPVPTDAAAMASHLTAAPPAGHGSDVEDGETFADLAEMHEALHEGGAEHTHGAEEVEESVSTEIVAEDVAEDVAEERAEEAEPTVAEAEAQPADDTAESVVERYVNATQALVAFAVRTPEAFGSRESSEIYAAERSVEQTLIDLGTERSVGADVARQHATRDKILREVLGRDLTVENLRVVMAEAADGRQAKEELVRDAVAMRVGVHGESFDAAAYADMLRTQSMKTIRDERDAWQEAKRQRFTAGRSVVPRGIKDGKVEKRAPARPAVTSGEQEQSNLLADR